MTKILLFILSLFFCFAVSVAQPAKNRTLFVIDSIPLLRDPQVWNPITADDIADASVVTNRDSLKLLGGEKLEAITYVFTKAYRLRPDSIRRIPSLYQMRLEKNQWLLNGTPYNGRFITYYNNGQRFDEGTMVDGKKDGWFIVYFRNGQMRSYSYYKEGLLHGELHEFYKTGALKMKKWFEYGSFTGVEERYFLNGKAENAWRPRKATPYDTLVGYYSTGKIKNFTLFKNGTEVENNYGNGSNYPVQMFYLAFRKGELKKASRYLYEMWKTDSTRLETQLAEALLAVEELRFDEAIASFDRVLATEPFMQTALLMRGLTRLRKQSLSGINTFSKDFKETPPTLNDLLKIDAAEQQKICSDLLLADELDDSDYQIERQVAGPILKYCREKMRRQ